MENDPLNSGDAVAELLQDLVAPGAVGQRRLGHPGHRPVPRHPGAPSVQAKIDRALAQIASLK